MLDMMKRHEIQVPRRAGHVQSEVAKVAGVSEQSVRRVERESPVVICGDTEREQRRLIGRPTKVEPFRQLVAKVLVEDPDLLSLEILRRARLDGYTGGKSALYAFIATEAGAAGGALRRVAWRVLSARLRPRRRPFPGRVEEALPLFRLTAQVLALGRGDNRPERAGGDVAAHAGRPLRRHGVAMVHANSLQSFAPHRFPFDPVLRVHLSSPHESASVIEAWWGGGLDVV